jgi:hypothetical protein
VTGWAVVVLGYAVCVGAWALLVLHARRGGRERR